MKNMAMPTTVFHSFVLLFISAKLLLNFVPLEFNFFIKGEAAPGSLLLFQGLPAVREVFNVDHIGRGIVTPVDITQESIVFTLHVASMCSYTH